MKIAEPAFNKAQREMLDIFSKNVDEETLAEIKHAISKILLRKSRTEANKAMIEKGITNKDLEKITGIKLD